MAENIKEYDDEIDLLSLLLTIWEGKWKIVSIMAVSLLSVFSFDIIKPNKTFIAQTEIKTITSFEFDKYRLFNASLIRFNADNNQVKIFNISKKSLLALYIEQIDEGTLLEIGIDKFELIDKDEFDNDKDYREAIQKFASKIEVIRPINGDKKAKGEIRLYHVLRAEYDDEEKWKQLITFLDTEANKRVKEIITNRFKSIVSVEEQIKTFLIRDIDIAIENQTKDYDRITKDRLAFLSEQAVIARKLGVKKNTIESQMFGARNTVVTNVNTDTPFYLRGYEAIEEEINLTKGRKDKSAFMKDLYKLEQKKRRLKQDESLDRAKDLFKKTPLNENDFKSTLVKVAATDFEIINKRNLYYVLALVLGGMIGVVFVLISKAIIDRKAKLTQS
jgi:LPS O-antigen subunit length determinant protein (WzzB/FepE family)